MIELLPSISASNVSVGSPEETGKSLIQRKGFRQGLGTIILAFIPFCGNAVTRFESVRLRRIFTLRRRYNFSYGHISHVY